MTELTTDGLRLLMVTLQPSLASKTKNTQRVAVATLGGLLQLYVDRFRESRPEPIRNFWGMVSILVTDVERFPSDGLYSVAWCLCSMATISCSLGSDARFANKALPALSRLLQFKGSREMAAIALCKLGGRAAPAHEALQAALLEASTDLEREYIMEALGNESAT